jgi:FkbM family methyltransferase
MNLQRLVAEHTIDVDLLPESPLVLDVGCRRFNFCEEILALRPKAQIIAFDPGPDIEALDDMRITFMNFALMHGAHEGAWLSMNDCSSIVSTVYQDGLVEVPVIGMDEILYHWPYFDLMKFDCEGCEFAILENWPGKCAGQINIEFHDNMVSPDGKGLPQSYFDELFHVKLSDYRVIQNEPDSLGTHADALLVLNSSI